MQPMMSPPQQRTLIDPNVECPNAGEIKTRWEDCTNDMLAVRRNFRMNEAFVHGQQWLRWVDSTQNVLPVGFRSEEESQYRATVNKLRPHVTRYIARLVGTPLSFEPQAEGVDSEDMKRRQIAKQVLSVESHRHEWEQAREDACRFALYGGVSAIAWEPDWASESLPIPDPVSGQMIGLPTRPSVKVTALSPTEFGIEPGSRSDADASWWIRCTSLTPKQARDRYQLDYDPTPDTDMSASVMHHALLSQVRGGSDRKSCLVHVYYEKPTSLSAGCVVHVVGGKIVQQNPWPFARKDRLNVVTFSQNKVAGTWKGDTFLTDCRQIQVNYNRCYTTMNSYLGKADAAKLIMPQSAQVGESENEWSGDVGEIITVTGDGPSPMWLQPPQISRGLRELMSSLEGELDDQFSAQMVTRGEAPGDRNSGLALSILAEKDETPLGLVAKDQQRGWQVIAEHVLSLNRHLQNMSGVPVSDVLPNADPSKPPQRVQWTAADLPENPVVIVPLDSVMPRSTAANQEFMFRLATQFPQMFQNMSPQQLANLLQTPDTGAFAQVINPQEALAEWENGRMTVGSTDEEVAVEEWYDHAIHIDKHNALRASSAYRDADPQVKQYIDLHVQAHQTIAQQLMQEQFQQQLALQQQTAAMAEESPTEQEPKNE